MSAKMPLAVRSPLARLALQLATGLCVLAVPVGLVCSNVRVVTLDQGFYLVGFQRYGGAAAVDLSPEEQRYVANAFISYFQAPPGRLDVQLARGNSFRPLFNEREVQHMVDVQALMHLVFRLGGLALAYIALYALVGALLLRRRFMPLLARVWVGGAALTLVTLLALGALALVDFESLFVQFHLLSFDNDLWQLDPRRDNLIRLFPQAFWFEAALRVLALTVVQALAIGAAGLIALRLVRPRASNAP